MNTKTIIGIVVAIIVIGGLVWYFSTQQTVVAPSPSGGTTQNTGSASFAQFVAQGGSRSCDVVVNNPETPGTGIVYISGDQVRGDFTTKPTTLNGGEIRAHMLQTGGFVYSWADTSSQGVKVRMGAGATATSTQGVDPDAQVSYDCSPWTPDASKFIPPSTITFMELNASGQVQP